MYNISVIGGSTITDEYCMIARRVGELLARNKSIVFCGGLSGVMECVADGVKSKGGIVVGILPGYSPMEGNSNLTVSVPTGMGFARNFLVIRAGEAVIAIDGSAGTLSEAAFAISEGKDIISLGSAEIVPRKKQEGKFIRAATPDGAVDMALSSAKKFREKFIEIMQKLKD
ncbi:ABC-type spermidine/putrescine transport systems, ATPase components [Thermoplasmatales archaeon]|nr:ABC-type spermidine/putrescine transport systems, ATPase components [Thermoplasmatales archaeon]